MPTYYFHLAAIVFAQFAVVAALCRWRGRKWNWRRLLGLLAVSVPIGSAFDLIIGRHGEVFSYPSVGQSLPFLFLNSLLSYGAAACTAWLLPCKLPHHEGRAAGAVIAGSAAVAGFVLLELAIASPLLEVLFLSLAILTAAEVTAVAFGQLGPIAALAMGQPATAICLITSSAVVGAIYEGANELFPLWRWHLGLLSPAITETLIVFFGYFVLLHPMFIISRTMFGEPHYSRQQIGDR